MTDISSKIVKNSFFVYVGKIINLSISFFIFIHIANYLGEELFGKFSIAIAYIATFGILVNFGLNQFLVRELSAQKFDQKQILGAGILFKLLLTIIALIIASITAQFFNYSHETVILIWIISFNLITSSKLQSTRMVFESIFQAQLKMKYPIIFNVIDNLVFAALIIVFTVIYPGNLITIAIIYVICNLPGAVMLIYKFFNNISVSFVFDCSMIKYIFIESFPLFLYIMFSTLNTKIDILMLSSYKGDADVGYFSAAFRLVYPLIFLSTSFSISLFPLLSKYIENNKSEFTKFVKIGFKFIILLGVFLATFGAFHAKKIILTLYVSSFEPAAASFQILIVCLGFIFINFYFVDIFVAARKQTLLTFIMATALAINIILNIFLIPKFGHIGASYVRLFTYFFIFVLFNLLLYFKLKIRGVFEYNKMILLTAIFLLSQILFKNINLLLAFILSVFVFGGLCLIFKIISIREVELLKRILQNKKTNFKETIIKS
ncbi:flippase [candidate division KSB1 bacterium]|nr:flippase [candidate division KSB1 bacterium]MBL7093540.1 flippase [candidate division KSB1 bacterium]